MNEAALTAGEPSSAPWPAPVPLSDLPVPSPFPLSVLPSPLQQFILESAEALNCPVDFLGVAMLAVAGGAVGNTRRLFVKGGWYESACLYACVIAEPGSNKSAAHKLIMKPIHAAEDRFQLGFAAAREGWHAGGCQGPEPRLRELSTGGGTTEGIIRQVSENDRGIIYGSDELRRVAESLNQYKTVGRGDDKVFYLQAWDHTPYSAVRRGREKSLRIARPFMAIVGSIQPDLITTLCGPGAAAPKDGFFDRFLLSFPVQPEEKPEDFAELDVAAEKTWSNIVAELLSWHGKSDGSPEIHNLSREARDRYREFTRRHVLETNSAEFDKNLAGAWKKLRGGYCMRLALILHCLDSAGHGCFDPEVSGDCLDRAAALIDYFKSHARRVRAVMHRRRLDPDVVHVWESILNQLSKNGEETFKQRDLFCRLRRRFNEREVAFEKVLGILCDHNLLRPLKTPIGPEGGRPSGPAFAINPRSIGRDLLDEPNLFSDFLGPASQLARLFADRYVGAATAHRSHAALTPMFAEWINKLGIDPDALLNEILRPDRDASEPPWDLRRRLFGASANNKQNAGLDAFDRMFESESDR